MGEFYGNVDDLESSIATYKKPKLNSKTKLLRHLEERKNDKRDESIYSCYTIIMNKDNPNKLLFYCTHNFDVTKKPSNNLYSLKSEQYSSEISSYAVDFDVENQSFISKY